MRMIMSSFFFLAKPKNKVLTYKARPVPLDSVVHIPITPKALMQLIKIFFIPLK